MTLLLILGLILSGKTTTAQDGAGIFRTKCSACHKIGGGRLVGPDLNNVTERRDKDWLRKMISNASELMASGDPEAVQLKEEYPTVMPPQNLSDAEMDAVLAYIESQSTQPDEKQKASSGQQTTASSGPSIDLSGLSAADIQQGRKLFSGAQPLVNGGPSCLSCHNVKDDKVTGGGLLARDLTTAWSRLGKQGLHGMITNPAFPAMQEAYKGRQITKEEALKLTGYLKNVDEERYYQHAPHYQSRMLYTGIGGALVLLGGLALLWIRRRKGSINDKIFERQVKSRGEIKGLYKNN